MPPVDADARFEGDIPHDAEARLSRATAGAMALDVIALLQQYGAVDYAKLSPAVAATVRGVLAEIDRDREPK